MEVDEVVEEKVIVKLTKEKLNIGELEKPLGEMKTIEVVEVEKEVPEEEEEETEVEEEEIEGVEVEEAKMTRKLEADSPEKVE